MIAPLNFHPLAPGSSLPVALARQRSAGGYEFVLFAGWSGAEKAILDAFVSELQRVLIPPPVRLDVWALAYFKKRGITPSYMERAALVLSGLVQAVGLLWQGLGGEEYELRRADRIDLLTALVGPALASEAWRGTELANALLGVDWNGLPRLDAADKAAREAFARLQTWVATLAWMVGGGYLGWLKEASVGRLLLQGKIPDPLPPWPGEEAPWRDQPPPQLGLLLVVGVFQVLGGQAMAADEEAAAAAAAALAAQAEGLP